MLHDKVQYTDELDFCDAAVAEVDFIELSNRNLQKRGGARLIDRSALARFSRTDTVGGAAKRLFDIVFAGLALLALSVPIIVIAVALKLLDRGPVWFAHNRVGAGGRMFPCLKFRTMVTDADIRLQRHLASDPEAASEFARTRKLLNDPRIIPGIGSFLRKTSLDELPQFVNVLLGDMSVVGPRPVTSEEFEHHYGYDHPYMATRPGVTGLWQVSGRNDVTYSERVHLDETYARTWTFWRDLKIIIRTMMVVCYDRNGH